MSLQAGRSHCPTRDTSGDRPGGIFAETPNRIFIANRGELKLPDKLPRNFTGFWGSFGSRRHTGTPVFKNCIVVVDANGKLVEAWTQWDHLFEDGRGPHSVLISPYDPEHNVWVVDDIHIRSSNSRTTARNF